MSGKNASPSSSVVAALANTLVHGPVSLCIFTLSTIAMFRYLAFPRRVYRLVVIMPLGRIRNVYRYLLHRLVLFADLGYNFAWLRSIGSGEDDGERSRTVIVSSSSDSAADSANSDDDDDDDDDDEAVTNYASGNLMLGGETESETGNAYTSTSDTDSDGSTAGQVTPVCYPAVKSYRPAVVTSPAAEAIVESYLNDYYTELHRSSAFSAAIEEPATETATTITLTTTERPSERACFIIGADDYEDDQDDDNVAHVATETDQAIEDEPLLDQTVDEDRFLLFPIKHQDLFDLYKLQVAQFWTAEEINLTKDVHDWQLLTAVEQNFFKRILAFFAPSDGIVGENLITRFYNDIGYTEAKYFYVFQAMMENIHAEVYGLLIKNLIPSDREQNELFRAFATTPGIREKVEWAEYWLHSDRLFVERLVAFSVVEGLLFSGSFASIFWLKKKGILPGLTFSNELISRDESLHCDFACHLYTKHVRHHLPHSRVQDMVRGAVNAETIFFAHAFANGPVGEMNQETMLTYVKFCADRLLLALNCEPIYHVSNPFEFMHLISLDGRTNFFERRVGDYRQSMVSTSNITDEKIHLPGGQMDLSDDF